MAKYGGHEDFEKERQELESLRKAREQQIARENTFQSELAKSTRVQDESAAASRVRSNAKRETVEVDDRAARSARNAAKATEVDTAAIKANTEARQRANQVRAFGEKAIQGARSPQYGQAYSMYQESGSIPSQYRLRQQLQGVGQRRAAGMVQAMQAGLVPSTGNVDVNRPLARMAAAHEAVADAEYKLAQATREHERIKRSGTAEEARDAYAARQDAKTRLQSSRSELQDAESAHASRQEALREEAKERVRQQETLSRVRQSPLVESRGQLPAPGQTAQGMPVVPAETRTRVNVGPVHPDTGAREQEQTVKTMNVQRLALPPAGGTTQGMPVYPAETRTRVEIPSAGAAAGGVPPQKPNFVGGDPERVEALKEAELAARYSDQMAASQLRVARANQSATASFYPLSQAMHRHGALTSEFISAAARGEVTLRELGNQAVITAGKFGGWTVAATAVYGVASAFGKVAQGAMDAASGVNSANRGITQGRNSDQLQKSFANLSKTYNVPVNVAADAVYRMGLNFHNQADAVKAAEASLLSYKTGEVSVAQSTNNLIAIQRAFGLSATDLVAIYDQIDQAQNLFNVGINDSETGLAKAGGTWKAAGGDLSYLLALMTAITKATGSSGNVIGTAMARLYYVQHPESLNKLKKLGVDASPTDVQGTFQSAFDAAKKRPQDAIAIATGLVGPQYQRLLTPVLQDQKTLNDALRDTSAEASKGAGMKELGQVLKQVDEQIAALGHGFERLGVAVGRAGGFEWAGLLLKALNATLSTATALVNVFNLIPQPLRGALTMLAEMAVAITLLRKLGATERLANTPLGFLADPAGRQRTHTIVGLRQGQTEAYNRVERFGSINVDTAFRSDLTRQRANELGAAYQQTTHLDPQDPRRRAAQQAYITAELQATEAETALAMSTAKLDAARQVATRVEEDLAVAQATSRRQFQATAEQRGWVYPARLDQPNMAGVNRPGAAPSGIILPRGYAEEAAGGAAASADGEAAMTRSARAAAAMERKAAVLAAGLATMNTGSALLNRSGQTLSKGTLTAGAGLGRAAGVVGRAGGSLRSLVTGMGGLLAALGPLDIAFVALIGFGLFSEKLKSAGEHADQVRDQLTKATSTQQDVQAQLDKANQVINENPPATPRQFADNSPHGLFGPIKGLLDLPKTVHSIWQDATGTNLTAEAEKAREVVENRLQLQAQQRQKGAPIPQLTYGQLIENIQKDQDDRKAGIISASEFDHDMANHAIELKTLLDATQVQKEKAKQALQDAARAANGPSYDQALRAMSSQDFSQEQEGTAAAVSLYGLTPHNMDFLKRQYKAAEELFRASSKPADLISLNNARNAYFNAIIQEANTELQLSLLQARSEGERRTAFAKASAEYKQMEVTFKQQRDAMKKTFKQQQEDLKRKQNLEDQGGTRHQQGINDDGNPQAGGQGVLTAKQQAEREERQRKARLALTAKQKQQLDAEIDRQNRQLTLAELQLKEQAYEDRQQGRQTLLNLQVSETQDPLRQATLRLQMARRQVQDAQAEWGTRSRQYREALTDLNNAQLQQAQAILAGVQADDAVLLAQAGGDPVQQAKVAASNAQRELDTMLANRGKFDPNAIKQQRATVIDSKRAAKDAADQQAQDLARLQGELASAQAGDDPVAVARAGIEAAKLAKKVADTPTERLQALVDLAKANNDLQAALVQREMDHFDLLKSQTDDPVQSAKLDLEAAKYALAHSKGEDKVKKQTDYNNAKKSYQEAKISDREDTINFEYQMDQITADEAAKQLEALANMKGISKAKKRELLLQAKQLRDEASGDYELDVGDIRLPSLYEVKRFVQGGQPNASQIVTDNRNFTVYLGSAEAVNAFAQQLEITNGTSAAATAKSMQMR